MDRWEALAFRPAWTALTHGGGDFRRALFFRIFRDFLFGGDSPDNNIFCIFAIGFPPRYGDSTRNPHILVKGVIEILSS